MKDDNWQEVLRDPSLLRADIADHLRAENAYTQSVLSGTEALQEHLVAEMKGRMQADDTYPPAPHGPYCYQTSYTAGAQYPVYKRYLTASPAAEEVLLDVNEAAGGHEYYAVAAAAHSPDHTLFAHAEDTQGSEIYRIRIRRLSGEATPCPRSRTVAGRSSFRPTARSCSGSGATAMAARPASIAAALARTTTRWCMKKPILAFSSAWRPRARAGGSSSPAAIMIPPSPGSSPAMTRRPLPAAQARVKRASFTGVPSGHGFHHPDQCRWRV